MRDYSNGGFFFIDAAPIIAAGENGLKIESIFEDAKRAFKGGKVVVAGNFPADESGTIQGATTGYMSLVTADDKVVVTIGYRNLFTISNDDIIKLTV